MELSSEQHTLELRYSKGKSNPDKGYYEGGVEDPAFMNELKVWVDEEKVFDFDTDSFRKSGKHQIHISGSKRAIYEVGKYLVALSQYETDNSNYHDHLDGFCEMLDKAPCEIVAHFPE